MTSKYLLVAGDSGSPVLRQDGCAIGVHVSVREDEHINEASVIGPLGNDFDDFVRQLRIEEWFRRLLRL